MTEPKKTTIKVTSENVYDLITKLVPFAAELENDFCSIDILRRAKEFQEGTSEWDRKREALASLPSRTIAPDLVTPLQRLIDWRAARTVSPELASIIVGV